jgi:hypothetical protein
MADLGPDTVDQHHLVLSLACDCADLVIAVGPTYQRLDRPGAGQIEYFTNSTELLESHALERLVDVYRVIGVKGSYVTGMLPVADAVKRILIESAEGNKG